MKHFQFKLTVKVIYIYYSLATLLCAFLYITSLCLCLCLSSCPSFFLSPCPSLFPYTLCPSFSFPVPISSLFLPLPVSNTKIMHIGYNNSKTKHEMNDKYLEEVTEERDLGAIMQSDRKIAVSV